MYTKIEMGVSKDAPFFGLYSEGFLRDLDVLTGFIIGENNLNNVKYTDDTILMTDTERNFKNYSIR